MFIRYSGNVSLIVSFKYDSCDVGDQQLPGWYRCSFLLPKKYSFPKLWWWELMWQQEKKNHSLSFHFSSYRTDVLSLVVLLWTLHLMWLLLNPLLSFSISPPPHFKPKNGVSFSPLGTWTPDAVDGPWCQQRRLGPVCILSMFLSACWFSTTLGIPFSLPRVWEEVLNS